MISIIMPVWNGARFIDRAIASVVAQTSREWELLVVDDGSTDDSPVRIRRWAAMINGRSGEEKIRLFSTGRPRSGPQVGRNLAAKQARYEIFAYLDHDDLYSPLRIESLLRFFDDYDLTIAPYEISEEGKTSRWDIRSSWVRDCKIRRARGRPQIPFDVWIRQLLQQQNFTVPLGVAHRRQVFEEVGGFQPGIVVGEDGVLWRRMADRGARIGFCPVIAGRYHVLPESQARTRRPFSLPSFDIRKDDPLGSNGQYLDAEWFAALRRGKPEGP